RVTDVVVIGFGAAGSSAAIEASDAGAEVLVLEKMRKPGGALSMAGGLVYAAGTSVQRAAGITDTAEEMYNYSLAGDRVVKDPALVRIMADQSGDAIEWLIALGADFPPEELSFTGAEREFAYVTPPRPRGHHFRTPPGHSRYTGYRLFAVLEKAVRARNIEVMLETAAKELATNSMREVVGVKARSQGNDLVIRARRAVVIADGGFAQNPEMIRQYLTNAPAVASGRIARTSHPGQTGDGIRMAMALGADLCDMAFSLANIRPFVPVDSPSIFVNGDGRRFANERLPIPLGSTALDRQDSVAFQIFDDKAKREAVVPGSRLGRLVSAPTIGELASKLGLPSDRLEKTVQIWNRHSEMGEDPEFGKTGSGVGPIGTSPFWGGALLRRLNIHSGGLKTNSKAQVLDALNGRPISRLYAAGQNTGGRLGVFYPGAGSALTDCFVFGRIGGKNAAGETPIDGD
ncbi:MAG: FAD-dependent oxidoreductase, partial [Dehalococcoidia bacterium]|nr:FAD-dependent oxidoreductase [Dehalococcoidia bacterium]